MMERTEFDALVAALDSEFDGRTDALTRHTYRWMLLGYAVVIVLTMLLIGGGLALFVAGTLWPGPGIALVVVGGVMMIFGCGQVGALVMVEQPEPEGIELHPDQAVKLRQLLRLLCEQMKSPLPERILLTEDFNAAIAQQPRLGIFGWSRSWLILGVPLMLAVSPEELAAVLAHECGHLSMKHGRQGNRIYQMHQSWERLFQRLQEGSGSLFARLAGSIVMRFLTWYWPRFHARAFVLSRRNEFLADARAADTTSVRTSASALYRIECLSYFLEQQFWKTVWDETVHREQPPADLCERLRTAYRNAPDSDRAARWCEHAISRVSNSEESHPSMSERLLALGLEERETPFEGFPQAPEVNAFDALLGDDSRQLQTAVNERWKNQVSAIWSDRHRRIAALHSETNLHPSNNIDSEMDAARLWEQTRRLIDAQGLEAAERQIRQVLQAEPNHPGALFAFGQLRLDQGQDDGESLLHELFQQRTVDWTEPAGQLLERHYTMTGRSDRAADVRRELDRFEKDRQAAEDERLRFDRGDSWTEHNLSEMELSLLKVTLAAHRSCRRAWLAKKQLQYFQEEPLYVLCVESTGKRRVKALAEDQLVAPLMLNCELPGRLLVISPSGEFRRTAKHLMNLPSTAVYQLDRDAPILTSSSGT